MRITPERDERSEWNDTYSLRFRPTSRKERKSARKLFDIETELTKTKWNKSLSAALARRYQHVIDLAGHEVETALAQRRLALDRSLLKSEEAATASSNFNVADLQQAALRLQLREQEVQRLVRKTTELRNITIADYLIVPEEGEPKVSPRLIQPEDIGVLVDILSAAPASTSFDHKQAKLEVGRARQEMALAKSRTAFGLSLMELSYENKEVDSYNMTFGFRLPFARRTHTSQRRVRELMAAEQQAYLTEQRFADTLHNAVREIRWQIDAYAANSTALQSVSGRLQSSSTDIAALVVLRRHQLELLETAASTHIRLLHDFVVLLDMIGGLQEQPLKNWIRGK
ncbi:MAG: hypothetical protein ACR2P1_08690 [Pseudomonadales bacterium]